MVVNCLLPYCAFFSGIHNSTSFKRIAKEIRQKQLLSRKHDVMCLVSGFVPFFKVGKHKSRQNLSASKMSYVLIKMYNCKFYCIQGHSIFEFKTTLSRHYFIYHQIEIKIKTKTIIHFRQFQKLLLSSSKRKKI